ncbi:MAG: DEAD/DEAH box helicase, partial [Bdellovibrionales bacterium]|nr:DEAD/DEAH box helicase [Bdellovibrionales bacterium]
MGEIQYNTDIQYLKGVGPKLSSLLAGRNIYKVKDLLEWYPRAYEDRRQARNIRSLKANELVSMVATVRKVSTQPLGRGHRKMYLVLLGDESGFVTCKFFRTPYKGYFERFQPGTQVRVVGKTSLYRNNIEFHHPDLRDFDETENEDRIVAIYTETDGLPPRKVRNILTTALLGLKGKHIDPLPAWLREKYNLIGREEAITKVHIPPQEPDPDFLLGKSIYHERLIFDEFFWLELYLASRKTGVEREIGPEVKDNLANVSTLEKSLPFELTGAQKKSFEEIKTDMLKPYPMHRLVQGDVGSGKTAVALLSCAYAIRNGFQTAIMAPTEILAEQHLKNAIKFLT